LGVTMVNKQDKPDEIVTKLSQIEALRGRRMAI
jgi:hypothetical protein